MKNCNLPLLLCGLVVMMACKKNDVAEESVSCTISSIISDSAVVRFHYNADGSLQSRVTAAVEETATVKSDSVAYAYETDKITVRKFNAEKALTLTSVFPLGNNGYASTQINKAVNGLSTDTTFFTYNQAGYLIASEQRVYSVVNNKSVLSSTTAITYTIENGNTTSRTLFSTNAFGTVTQAKASYEFYADKAAVKYLYGDYTFTGKEDANLLKKSGFNNNGTLTEETYSYRYNERNLPDAVEATYTSAAGSSGGSGQVYYNCQ